MRPAEGLLPCLSLFVIVSRVESTGICQIWRKLCENCRNFRILRNRWFVYQILDWNKDYKAGKTPKTDKEREAAARKYNLHPSEYQPYPEDGMGWGDYPKLPDKPVEAKDLYYPYDMPEHKRNFGEPIHIDYPIWSEDRFGTAAPSRFSMQTMFLTFAGVMTAWFALYFYFEDKKLFRPALPKQLPGDGRPHYTFEPKQ